MDLCQGGQSNKMEVDEIEEINVNSNCNDNNNIDLNNNKNPNTNSISQISIISSSNTTNNSMEIDTNFHNESNKENKTNNKSELIPTTKRRKKRTRDEMEIDSNDIMNNSINNNSSSSISTCSLTTNSMKRRKISTTTTSKTPQKSIIEAMPEKWQNKYKEYTNIIIENYKKLCTENNTNKLLFESEETQNEIKEFQIDLKASNNIDFEKYIGLICKLSYGRNEGLTDLAIYIKRILFADYNGNNNYNVNVREMILKSSQRKLYGIKPISKTINKTEEKMDINLVSSQWNKCRIYLWESLNIDNIPKQYQMDNKQRKNLSLNITKYGTFCKKYDILSIKKGMKSNEKDANLQKIEDGLISWKSKQQQNEIQRAMKQQAIRKKKEAREQQIKERKEKKEEMEKLKKEKAEQKQKEKEDKLKKEKERKEKLEKERLEKLEKKKQENKTPQNLIKTKKKQRKPSFMDNWVKITKFADTTNANTTPIIMDKTISLSTNNESMSQSLSLSISPSTTPKKNKTLYQRIFIPPKYAINTIIAPIHSFKENYKNQIKIINERLVISEKIRYPKPRAIPSVFIKTDNDEQDPIDLTKELSTEIDGMVSRMQIDEEQKDKDINMNDEQIKLQWKYRYFYEDNRPSFFGINKYDEHINIIKLCRSPFMLMDINKKVINYESDDSGVEWYDDIDDLEDCEDLDDIDEDEEALVQEIKNQEKKGLIRSDGFENDQFIINSDDDDDDALRDKNIMKDIEKHNKLKNKLKDEYPIKFKHQRQRGDQLDKPIIIKLPSIIEMKTNNVVLYQLMMKKTTTIIVEDEGIDAVNNHNEEKENDIDYLLQIENKNNNENDKSSKDKDEKKKKKKKKKKDKKKDKKKINDAASMKMECDDNNNNNNNNEEDEDDDIKMMNGGNGGNNNNISNNPKPKISKQNTLTHYFNVGKSSKSNTINENNNNGNNNKEDKENKKNKENKGNKGNKGNNEKKKKRRVVVCELVE